MPFSHAAIFSESLLLKSTPGGRVTLGFGRRSFQFQSVSGSSHLGCPRGAHRGAWPSKPQELHHTREPRAVMGHSRADPVCPQPTDQTKIITSNSLMCLSSLFKKHVLQLWSYCIDFYILFSLTIIMNIFPFYCIRKHLVFSNSCSISSKACSGIN